MRIAIAGTLAVAAGCFLTTAACSDAGTASNDDPPARSKHSSAATPAPSPQPIPTPPPRVTVPTGRMAVTGFDTESVAYNDQEIEACLRLFRIVAGDGETGEGLLGIPFMLDGRKVLATDAETAGFLSTLHQKRSKEPARLAVFSMRIAPPKTDHEAVREWFGPGIDNERAKALHKHVTDAGGTLVMLTLGKLRSGKVATEDVFVGVSRDAATSRARVIGFMD